MNENHVLCFHLISRETTGQSAHDIGVAPFLPLADSGCIHDGSSGLLDACDVLRGDISVIGLYSSVLEG